MNGRNWTGTAMRYKSKSWQNVLLMERSSKKRVTKWGNSSRSKQLNSTSTKERFQKLILTFKRNITRLSNKLRVCIKITPISRVIWIKQYLTSLLGKTSLMPLKEQKIKKLSKLDTLLKTTRNTNFKLESFKLDLKAKEASFKLKLKRQGYRTNLNLGKLNSWD